MRATLCCILLSLLVGCGSSNPKTVAVLGTVKSKSGQPCDGALVVFHPQAKDKVNDPKPVATTDSSGNFALTTFAENDGAVPGDYGVTVVWPEKSGQGELSLTGEGGNGGKDRLQGRYGDPRAPLIQLAIPASGKSDVLIEVDG